VAAKPTDLMSPCPVCDAPSGCHYPACPSLYENVEPKKIKSDGGSSAYYRLPEGATELNDLIEHREMSFARGNIFKALYRLGEKAGVDVSYDLNKIEVFLQRLRKMNAEGKPL
jgi:hypothetical protein